VHFNADDEVFYGKAAERATVRGISLNRLVQEALEREVGAEAGGGVSDVTVDMAPQDGWRRTVLPSIRQKSSLHTARGGSAARRRPAAASSGDHA